MQDIDSRSEGQVGNSEIEPAPVPLGVARSFRGPGYRPGPDRSGEGGPPGAPPGAIGGAAGREAAILDPLLYKSTITKGSVREFSVYRCRCGSRACPKCRPKLGFETKSILLGPACRSLFQSPGMMTLTVRPDRFSGPAEAHDFVMTGEYVARLMRLLDIRVWVCTLEFHKSGWPHWHVIYDLGLPAGADRRNRLRRVREGVWRYWRDQWGLALGGLDVKAEVHATLERAVYYLCTYLFKPGDVPRWFYEGSHRRMLFKSQAVPRLTRAAPAPESAQDGCAFERAPARPLLARVASCCESVHLVERRSDGARPEVWSLPVSLDGLLHLRDQGRLPSFVQVVESEERSVRPDGSVFVGVLVVVRLPGEVMVPGPIQSAFLSWSASLEPGYLRRVSAACAVLGSAVSSTRGGPVVGSFAGAAVAARSGSVSASSMGSCVIGALPDGVSLSDLDLGPCGAPAGVSDARDRA